jgi:4-amino-4-deoxy-L-arabinose transferase-like glycosyltransferase
VAIFCAAQVLLWSLMCAANYSSLEIDSAEQFVWAVSMEGGYWKHPPLPSWIMHGLVQVFGASVVLPLAATQVCIVTALALTWRLGCEFMSPMRSFIAMALTSLVTYHNICGDSFNHNTVLLPFQAATVLLFYLACKRGAWHLWALAGLFAGLSMLVKYVALLPLAGLLLYVLLDSTLHTRRALSGLALAIGVFVLVLLPHGLWLHASNFLPFRYAQEVTRETPGLGATLSSLADFSLTQVIRLSPFLMGCCFLFRAKSSGQEIRGASALSRPQGLFLWTAVCAPLLLTMAFGLCTETALQGRWGANAFLLVGMVTMAQWRRPESPAMLRRCVQVVFAFQVVLCLGQTFGKTAFADFLGRRTRANFPGAELALQARRTWQAHTGIPLRLVVSDIWLGGNVIANSPKRLAVMIDGRSFKSPWVQDKAIDRCGALVLDDTTADSAGRGAPDPVLDALMSRARYTGTWTMPWAHAPLRPPAQGAPDRGAVRWGIILPTDGAACELS